VRQLLMRSWVEVSHGGYVKKIRRWAGGNGQGRGRLDDGWSQGELGAVIYWVLVASLDMAIGEMCDRLLRLRLPLT
jgi:hypothetical protein